MVLLVVLEKVFVLLKGEKLNYVYWQMIAQKKNYKALITALCKERKVLLCPVEKHKLLGEWSELCKRDRDGTPRKIVKCACVVIKDFAETSIELDFLLNHLKGGGKDEETNE